jgi:hypothetical protein
MDTRDRTKTRVENKMKESFFRTDQVAEIFKHLNIEEARNLCKLDKHIRSICKSYGFKKQIVPILRKNSIRSDIRIAIEKAFNATDALYHNIYKSQAGIIGVFNMISKLPHARSQLMEALATLICIEMFLKFNGIATGQKRYAFYKELANVLPKTIYQIVGEIIYVIIHGYIRVARVRIEKGWTDDLMRKHQGNPAMSIVNMYFSITEPNILYNFLLDPVNFADKHYMEITSKKLEFVDLFGLFEDTLIKLFSIDKESLEYVTPALLDPYMKKEFLHTYVHLFTPLDYDFSQESDISPAIKVITRKRNKSELLTHLKLNNIVVDETQSRETNESYQRQYQSDYNNWIVFLQQSDVSRFIDKFKKLYKGK